MRYWTGLLVITFGVLIGVQNPDSVPVHLLAWSVQWPIALSLLMAFIIGLVCGWLLYPLQKYIRKKS